MQHNDYHVVLLDKEGNVTGSKLRKEINKKSDILHCVDVFLLRSDGRIVLSQVPEGDLYAGKWVSSCATMLRSQEREDDAAARALKKELGLEDAPALRRIGSEFIRLEGDVLRMKTTYAATYDGELNPNADDVVAIQELSKDEVSGLCGSDMAAPSLKALWERYGSML